MTAHPSGVAFEDYSAKTLEASGYRIVARNFSSRYGEVDIIALKGDTIAFIEVKARNEHAMVSGFSAVTKAKQRKIIATALYYLKTKGQIYSGLQPRFDVMSIVISADGAVLSHDYLEGAFDSEAYYSKRY